MKGQDPSRYYHPTSTTQEEVKYRIELENYFARSCGSNVEKLQNFAKYVPTQDLRKFICRYEIFKKILNVHGSIIECGVMFGGGLLTWAQLSEVFEPLNHLRKVIGFDTFSGFALISSRDNADIAEKIKKQQKAIGVYEDLLESVRLYDKNRFLKHIPKVKLVKGDIKVTLPKYLKENPHTVVSLLYLDLNLFEPTVMALKHLVPRIPKGGIIAFDQLNHDFWPGETTAVIQELGFDNLKLERFPFGYTMCYAVID